MALLPTRTEKTTANPDFFIHVVDEGDTSQAPSGSSYKMKIGQLAANGGILYHNNSTINNPANTTLNTLLTYNLPANTLNQDGDSVEIDWAVGKTTTGGANNTYCHIFTVNDGITGSILMVAATAKATFRLVIVRISETSYSRYGYMVENGVAYNMISNKSLACDFTADFTVDFKMQNINVTTQGSFSDFIRIKLVKLFANSSSGLASPKKYVALLTQTGTNAPVATVLENSLGGTLVWTYDSVGNYTATLASAFTTNKTALSPINNDYNVSAANNAMAVFGFGINDANSLYLNSGIADANGTRNIANDVLYLSKIEITVYP